jgi:hypothetical protein
VPPFLASTFRGLLFCFEDATDDEDTERDLDCDLYEDEETLREFRFKLALLLLACLLLFTVFLFLEIERRCGEGDRDLDRLVERLLLLLETLLE